MKAVLREQPWESGRLGETDIELLHRAQRGDEAAFHGLMDRHAESLYRLAFALVGNAADAEDVVQESFYGAFRHLGRFEERSSVKTWMSRIVMRQAARHHRRVKRGRTFFSLDRLPESSGAAEPGISTSDPPADLRLDLFAVLQEIAPEYREVVVLRELQGMSYKEIAEALAVPQGTVESRLFRARGELREKLKDYLH